MYPVSLGFAEADRRIAALTANGHHAEALITSIFTFEKTLRRSLRFCAIKRGFTSKQATTLFANMGFKNLQEMWSVFSAFGEPLSAYIGQSHWQHVHSAVTMRNKLVHGERVYKLSECQEKATQVLAALRSFQTRLQKDIGFDGWTRIPVRRKSALQWLN